MSEHENNISLNEKLFARIKTVYELADKQNLPRNNPNYWKIFIPASYVTGQTCKETPKNSTATYARN